jgi:TrmH family RNA methyltransferase
LSPLTLAERKRLQSLSTKKGRRREKLFMAEGVRLLEESVRHKKLPQAVYFAPSGLTGRANNLLKRLRTLRVPLLSVSLRELNRLSDTETNQGLNGIFEIPNSEIDDIIRTEPPRILLLDNISDPGNAGTLIRSALAFCFDTILVTSGTVEPYNPKVVRSSAGAIFGVNFAEADQEILARLKLESGFVLWVADLSGHDLSAAAGEKTESDKIILAVGSEAVGPNPGIMKLADRKIRILHDRSVESLNAAVAGSIIMREIYQKGIGKKK